MANLGNKKLLIPNKNIIIIYKVLSMYHFLYQYFHYICYIKILMFIFVFYDELMTNSIKFLYQIIYEVIIYNS